MDHILSPGPDVLKVLEWLPVGSAGKKGIINFR